MRYSIPVKFIAVFLAALMLTVGFACIFGIRQVADLGLYTDGFDSWINNSLEWRAYDLAKDLTERFAVRSLTNCTEEFLEELGYWYVFTESVHWTGLNENVYNYSICDAQGKVLAEKNGILNGDIHTYEYQTAISVQFPVLVTTEAVIEEIYGEEYLHKKTVYAQTFDNKPVTVRYYESPQYRVNITMDTDAVMDRTGTSLALVEMIYRQRYNLIIVLAASLILLAACVVYICCAAGKKTPDSKARPVGINKIPLDIYLAVGAASGYGLGVLAYNILFIWTRTMENVNPGTVTLAGLIVFVIALIVVGFLFALAAQVKLKGGYWWRCSFLSYLFRWTWKGMRSLGGLMPMVWRHLLLGMGVFAVVAAGAALYSATYQWWLLAVGFALLLVAVLYICYAYGTILSGAKKMAKGNLDAKIDTKLLVGSYRQCADHLNTLADVAIVAAQKQMRSERMKTELITNISHDIKTPLTSIINYVDIMQKQQDAKAAMEYLEVLGRQSQRLKKLIEDLMEMSKASSGNIAVEIVALDPVESMHQALGEFSDKLENQDLTVVFTQPENNLAILADGRLTWRVLSNLLSNIVKYAMPGTRVYADITELENKVMISLKNISKASLNITAEELTERFVRGDASRNTEGSGLGLNIAKSLMELQKGQLKLMVDGDLFKATLVFPKAVKK